MEFVGILKPNPANPNRHNAHQIQLLRAIMFHDLRDWMQVLGTMSYHLNKATRS